jgi:uncharacterized protein (DUF2147 family)
MKMNRTVSAIAGAALFSLAAGSATAADPTGTWLAEASKSQVRIASCGRTLCGTLVSLCEPTDPATDKPKVDRNNADTGKRGRPLIGVAIVLGMNPNGPDKWAGQIYNAEDSKTYSGYITLTSANELKLRGCVGGGLICKTQTWTRTR